MTDAPSGMEFIIVDKDDRAEPCAPLADGCPAWRLHLPRTTRNPVPTFVADPTLAAWFSGQRHGGVMRVRTRELPGVGRLIDLVEHVPDIAVSESPAPDLMGVADREDGALPGYARRLRAFVEAEAWPDWHLSVGAEPDAPPGSRASIGMCRVTTGLVLAILREHDPDGGWQPDGGHPTRRYPDMRSQFKAAYRDLDGGVWVRPDDRWTGSEWFGHRGRWDGHYWTRGDRDGVILDITADQYGWDPAVVTGQDDPRYRANYRPATVAKDLRGPKLAAWCVRHAAGWKTWCAERGDDPAPEGEGPSPRP